jgi:nicotinamide-nucleotide amidase
MTPGREPRALTRAEIIAVGSELLTPWRQDTNSLFITERLNELGIEVGVKSIVGDDAADLGDVFGEALRRADLVILTGGLGPTDDDLTRDVVALKLGRPLHEESSIVEGIRARFESRGYHMPENNRRQAMVPEGATVLDNPRGTAPGLWIEHEGGVVVLLPGPPREMRPLMRQLIEGPLAARAATARLYRRVLKVTGWTESHLEEATQPIYSRWPARTPRIATTVLASPGQVELHLSVRAGTPEEGAAILTGASDEIRGVLGRDVFSDDGRSLEQVVGDLLKEASARVAVAESCTGGLLASRLTDVPGSSHYLELGVVCYSNAAKTALAGVPAALIAEHGAVSEPVAAALATGIRSRAGVDYGIGVTGIAGPGGGTPEKPVGTVAVAVAGAGEPRVRTFKFIGSRDMVKWQATQAGLNMLRRLVEDAR